VLKALLWLYSLFFLVTLFRLCVFILIPAQASAALDSILPVLSVSLLNRMRSLAEHDGLTGISNRTGIEKYLEAELLHRQDAPGRLMVLMLDIDRFKLINDTHGHDAGDRALIAMVKILTGHIRKSDRLGRWGGDEFLLISRDMEPDAAQDYAERIRAAIEGFPWASVITGAAEPVTVSIGYSISLQEDSVQTLLKRADLGLYQAKRAGRNRVCCK
jgi:diguanylate cyclase (GGDEF)-like protein